MGPPRAVVAEYTTPLCPRRVSREEVRHRISCPARCRHDETGCFMGTAEADAALASGGAGDRTCETCGAAARVRLLEGYAAGEPLFHSFCLACADRFRPAASPFNPSERLSFGTVFVLAGILLMLLGGFGDMFHLRTHKGFGLYQQFGVAIGLFMIVLAALLRVDVFAIIGLAVLGLASGGDIIVVTSSAGLGWKQQLALALGGAVTGIGLWLRVLTARDRRSPRRDARVTL